MQGFENSSDMDIHHICTCLRENIYQGSGPNTPHDLAVCAL
jgi:hypothetical protein